MKNREESAWQNKPYTDGLTSAPGDKAPEWRDGEYAGHLTASDDGTTETTDKVANGKKEHRPCRLFRGKYTYR